MRASRGETRPRRSATFGSFQGCRPKPMARSKCAKLLRGRTLIVERHDALLRRQKATTTAQRIRLSPQTKPQSHMSTIKICSAQTAVAAPRLAQQSDHDRKAADQKTPSLGGSNERRGSLRVLVCAVRTTQRHNATTDLHLPYSGEDRQRSVNSRLRRLFRATVFAARRAFTSRGCARPFRSSRHHVLDQRGIGKLE
jgi:hypothetical protein